MHTGQGGCRGGGAGGEGGVEVGGFGKFKPHTNWIIIAKMPRNTGTGNRNSQDNLCVPFLSSITGDANFVQRSIKLTRD